MTEARALVPTVAAPIAAQADSDAQLVAMWLHGRPASTRRAYERDVDRFLTHVGKPLRIVTLRDLQAYADSLGGIAPATRARYLSAVKSLLAFGHQLGYLAVNVGAMVKLPAMRNRLAERILPEGDVQHLIALEPDRRNRALLRLIYAGGLRRSELVGLRWRDLQPRGDAGQVTVFGKGAKTRTVLLPASVWRELVALRGTAGADAPVFRSRKGGPLEKREDHPGAAYAYP